MDISWSRFGAKLMLAASVMQDVVRFRWWRSKDAAAYVGASIGERKRLTSKCRAKACSSPPCTPPVSNALPEILSQLHLTNNRFIYTAIKQWLCSQCCNHGCIYKSSLHPFVNVFHTFNYKLDYSYNIKIINKTQHWRVQQLWRRSVDGKKWRDNRKKI